MNLTVKLAIDSVVFQTPSHPLCRFWNEIIPGLGRHLDVLVLDRGGLAPTYDNVEYVRVPTFEYRFFAAQAQFIDRVCVEREASLFMSTGRTSPLTVPTISVVGEDDPLQICNSRAAEKEAEISFSFASAFVCLAESNKGFLKEYIPGLPYASIPVSGFALPQFSFSAKKEGCLVVVRRKVQKQWFVPPYIISDDEFALGFVSGKPDDPAVVSAALGDQSHMRVLPTDPRQLWELFSSHSLVVFAEGAVHHPRILLEAQACGSKVVQIGFTPFVRPAGVVHISDSFVSGLGARLLDISNDGRSQAQSAHENSVGRAVDAFVAGLEVAKLNGDKGLRRGFFQEWSRLRAIQIGLETGLDVQRYWKAGDSIDWTSLMSLGPGCVREGTQIISPLGVAGHMFYGPYRSLGSGQFLVRVELELEEVKKSSFERLGLAFEIVVNEVVIHKSRSAIISAGTHLVEEHFVLTESAERERLQFRLWAPDGVLARLKKVVVICTKGSSR